MENASRALLLAAGIFIGLILLMSAMYLYNTIRDSKEAEYKILSEEQILKYNAEFESYNKTYMYGTDVITVLNKAIDLNKQNEWYSNKDYQINVTFKLNTKIQNYVDKFEYKYDNTQKKYIWSKEGHQDTNKSTRYILNAGKTYRLKDDEDFIQIEKFLDTQTEPTEYKIKKEYNPRNSTNESDLVYYEMYYTGFSDFKRKIFKCTGIDYDSFSGKVSAIHFEEVNITDEEN